MLRIASRNIYGDKKMMNRWLKGVAIAALTVLGTVAAQAADLPTRKEAPAPVFVPPPFTWTGFYVGLNAGSGGGVSSNATTVKSPGLRRDRVGGQHP